MEEYIKTINVIKKYNRFRCFRSTRGGGNILFAIDTKISPMFHDDKIYDVEVESKIYLYLFDAPEKYGVRVNPEKSLETWDFKTNLFGMSRSASFRSSIFLPDYLHSYGIGTVVMNQLIEIGKELFPDASISLKLAPAQASNIENRERRHRFYERFGFELQYEVKPMGYGQGSIDRVDKLKTTGIDEIKGIEEISIGSEIHELKCAADELTQSLKNARHANEYQLNTIREYRYEVANLIKYKHGAIAAGAIFVFVILGYLTPLIYPTMLTSPP